MKFDKSTPISRFKLPYPYRAMQEKLQLFKLTGFPERLCQASGNTSMRYPDAKPNSCISSQDVPWNSQLIADRMATRYEAWPRYVDIDMLVNPYQKVDPMERNKLRCFLNIFH
jgi:hypothetical protein